VSTAELDRLAASRIREAGAEPAADAGFPGSICLSVNEVAAHGTPSDYRLQAGDTVSVDVAVRLGGWCGDAAASF
jgi:methionyl aminopeptidase